MYYPIQPLKNQPHRLYINASGIGFTNISSVLLSQDGASFERATNLPAEIPNSDARLHMADNANLELGSSDFTIEGFIYNKGQDGYNALKLFSSVTASPGDFQAITIQFGAGNQNIDCFINFQDPGPFGERKIEGGVLPLNTMVHFAMVREGNNLDLYIDGVFINTVDVTGVSIIPTQGLGWDFGYAPIIIDEFRISNIARYTGQSNFSVPSGEFTSDANTLLLLHLNNSIVDASGNQTLSIVGNAVYNTSIKQFGTSALDLVGLPLVATENKLYIDLTASEMNADVIWVRIPESTYASYIDVLIQTIETPTNPTAQDIWEYSDRTLTSGGGGGLDLDTIVPDDETPASEGTVGQLLALFYRRFKKDRTRI